MKTFKNTLVAFLLQLAAGGVLFAQNMSINAAGETPDPSAMLDVQSTTQGFLMPRMTEAQRSAIVNPVDGLMVFQSDGEKGLYIFDFTATNWVRALDSSDVAALLANWNRSLPDTLGVHLMNTNMVTDGNWISGDGDDEGIQIDLNGHVGIGTSTPIGDLNVHSAAGWPEMSLSSAITTGAIFGTLSFTTPVYDNNINRSNASWQMGFTQVGAASALSDRWFVGRAGLSSSDLIVNREGNVGIGTSNPLEALDVNGIARVDSLIVYDGTNNPSIGDVLTAVDASGTTYWAAPAAADGDGIYSGSGSLSGNTTVTFGANQLNFATGATQGFNVAGTAFSVDGFNSRVGVGNINPTTKLDVAGNIRSGSPGIDGELILYSEQGATDYIVSLNPSGTMTQNTTYFLPPNDGNNDDVLTTDGTGNLSWEPIVGGIYGGSGSLSGATIVTQGASTLAFTSTATNAFSVDGSTFSVDASTNRVGIGTTAPSAALDVVGNIEIPAANEYTYATAKTGYVSVSPAAFTSVSAITNVIATGTGIGNRRHLSGGTAGTGEYLFADLQLPHGATITAVHVTVFDDNATYDADRELYRKNLGASTIVASLTTTGSTTGTGGAQEVSSTGLSIPVDNSSFAYYLRFNTRTNSTDLSIMGARITYTVTKAN